MQTHVALLRGINVGGKNALPMRELVGILEGLGARRVRTYTQSGNAVFRAAGKNASRLVREIGTEVKKRRGFEPHVLLLRLEDLEAALAANPFPDAENEPQTLHVGFLASHPKSPDLEKLGALRRSSERFSLIDQTFYLHAPEGVGRSKLAANAERLLGVAMTDRNWRTVCKIREMARELS